MALQVIRPIPRQNYGPSCFIDGLAKEVAAKIQVNYWMALAIILAVMAEAAQGFADVEIPGFTNSPLCLWILLVALSGDGKTPTEKALRKAIVEFERIQAAIYAEKKTKFKSLELARNAIRQEILAGIRRAARNGAPTAQLEEELVAHEASAPAKPKLIKLSYPDPTLAALKKGLYENHPNISITTDEGSHFFKTMPINAFATLNQGWDGSDLIIDRAGNDETLIIKDTRISQLIQSQPGTVDDFIKSKGDQAKDIGFLARFLVIEPTSLQGYRNISDYPPSEKYLPEFHEKVSKLLELSIDKNGCPIAGKSILRFEMAARTRFLNYREDIEVALRPGGYFSNAKDHAAKLTRNVARIAGLLHLFEHGTEDLTIRVDSLNNAIEIAEVFTSEYLRLFTSPPEVPPEQQDANKLYEWLCFQSRRNNNRYILKSDIMKNCNPAYLRKKAALEPPLVQLHREGSIGVWYKGDTCYCDLAPKSPPDYVALQWAIDAFAAKRKRGTS